MCKKNIDTYPLDKVDMDRMNGIKKRCIYNVFKFT